METKGKEEKEKIEGTGGKRGSEGEAREREWER